MSAELKTIVQTLFDSEPVGILATQSSEHPYCTIVAFTASGDLKSILIATPRFTSKYNNILKHPGVALMVDNRCGAAPDFSGGLAVNCLGRATTVPAGEFEAAKANHFKRHPGLRQHLETPDCVLVSIEIERYVIARGVRQTETLMMA